jgi:hypothetical protein
MSIDERSRHEIYLKFEETFGSELAAKVMQLLPPVGWGDVATRHDVRSEIENLRLSLELRIERSLRALTMWLVGTMIAVAAIALTIARFT